MAHKKPIINEIWDRNILECWPDIELGCAHARGELAFIFHDRYGLPVKTIWETIREEQNRG